MPRLTTTCFYTAVSLTLATAAGAQSNPDFEAALRAVSTATVARPANEAGPVLSTAVSCSTAPPRGTLPAEFGTPLVGRSSLNAAKQAANDGLLDALAWTEHHAGPVPLMPGARALRCRPSELRSIFTLGIEGSAEFRKVMDDRTREEAAIVRAEPPIDRSRHRISSTVSQRFTALSMDAEKLPATAAKLRATATFLRANGYVPYGLPARIQRWRRADAKVGSLTIDIELVASPLVALLDCSDSGASVPSGPIFFVFPAFPDPDWTDSVMTTVVYS